MNFMAGITSIQNRPVTQAAHNVPASTVAAKAARKEAILEALSHTGDISLEELATRINAVLSTCRLDVIELQTAGKVITRLQGKGPVKYVRRSIL